MASATSHRDRDDLDAAVSRLLFDFTAALRISMYRVVDDGHGELRMQRRLGLVRSGDHLGPDNAREVTRLPKVSDHAVWHECVMLRDVVHSHGEEGWLSVFPMLGEADVTGVLEIVAGGEGLDPRDASLVHAVLKIIRNHVRVLDYGERDTLTGLLNRKTFEASFGKLLRGVDISAGSGGEPAWLGVVDIDKFKSINDRYGHLFGDEVLLLVSRLMKQSFRGSDQLFRFGGEEFVIVLDRAGAEGASIAFNRFREAVANYTFPQIGKVTISLGYTRVLPGDSPASAIERADAALYFAKNNGRNQTHAFEALVEQGQLAVKETRADVELF